ncbi:MAG: hypothetical protein KC613_09860, partial [Myxococcales bacterium]|nr:hypothetical protein [Myxococcales bacterium]
MAGWASRARAILGRWLKGGTPAPAHPGTGAALDGRTAVALVEAALSDVASLGGEPDEVAAAFLKGLTGQGTNVLGGPVDGLHAEGARGAMATAIGLALSGVRATVFLDGAEARQAFDQVAEAAWRRVPLVIHLTLHASGGALGGDGGHAGYHALAESGAVLLMAHSVQHAVDLTVAARVIAEQGLVPVVVALDEAEIALGVQDLRLPEPVLLEGLVGAPGDRVDCPTAAQRHLLGPTRRRVPRWHDLSHPMQLGAAMAPELHGLAAAGVEPFFEGPLPGIIDVAFARLTEETGRPLARLETHGLRPADTVLVAQGAVVPKARAVVDALRAEGRAKAGVVGVTCLAPLDDEALVDALGGHGAVSVLSRGRRHLLSGVVQARLAAAVEAHVHAQPGMPALAANKLPRVFRAGYGLAPLRAIDLAVQVEHPRERVHLGLETRPGDSAMPKRQALVDLLRADFPHLGADAGRSDAPARDLRPSGARTVAVALGDDTAAFTRALAALLHDVGGGGV